MNPRKVFWVELLVVIWVLSFVGPAFSQARPGKTIAHAGVIEWVSRDFKYIGINERKILITPQTKILDDLGNSLRTAELRRGRTVMVEMVRMPGGSVEKRIIIKK
jgi:hypothetical protein